MVLGSKVVVDMEAVEEEVDGLEEAADTMAHQRVHETQVEQEDQAI
jgi:hypothetical protein